MTFCAIGSLFLCLCVQGLGVKVYVFFLEVLGLKGVHSCLDT